MPLPSSGAQARYFNALAQGRFELPRCTACARLHWPPRVVCPHCMGTRFECEAVSGAGIVHATATVWRKADAGGDLGLCLVDLDAGPRILSRVEGLAPNEVSIGLRVRMKTLQAGADALPLFEPVGATA